MTIAEKAMDLTQIYDNETNEQRIARQKAEAAHSLIGTCVETAKLYEINAATLSMHADNAV